MKEKKRQISPALPIWIEARFPRRLMKIFKLQLKSMGLEEVLDRHNIMLPDTKEKYESSRYKTEIYLHLSDERGSRFGHMDFAFGHKVYSYGCYDKASSRFFDAFSDGVLVVSPREDYINYCLNEEKKILIGYPLLLTCEQEALMIKKLREFRRNIKIWHPNSFYYRRGEKNDISDAASRLQLACGAHFYKVTRHRFKTYFALGANCALLIDECLGILGAERIMPRIGIISPGACYRYFELALILKKDFIAGRKIYALENKVP